MNCVWKAHWIVHRILSSQTERLGGKRKSNDVAPESPCHFTLKMKLTILSPISDHWQFIALSRIFGMISITGLFHGQFLCRCFFGPQKKHVVADRRPPGIRVKMSYSGCLRASIFSIGVEFSNLGSQKELYSMKEKERLYFVLAA